MKHLFIIGMEEEIERALLSQSPVSREHLIVLNCVGPYISDPYDSILRSVIIAVYQENVKEITIIGAARSKHSSQIGVEIVELMKRNGVQEKKINTVDYLFSYSNPAGFMANNLEEWLQGSETVVQGIQNTVELIQRHPLLPQEIKVNGLLLNTENGEFQPL
jgi:carbonic anhydrase